MPEGEILQLEDLPDSVLFDVLILVETAFPPLDETAGMRVLDAFMGPGAHESSEATAGSCPVAGDVDYVLHLGVIEEEAMDGAISSVYKAFCETTKIKPLHSVLASVPPSNELDEGVGIVGKEIDDLKKISEICLVVSLGNSPPGRDTCLNSIHI
jgi:hypothetical protein